MLIENERVEGEYFKRGMQKVTLCNCFDFAEGICDSFNNLKARFNTGF